MAINFSPEQLVAKYVKSATNGRSISIRLRRIITLFLFPLWIIAFAWSITMLYQGVSAINTAKKLDKAIKSEKYYYNYNDGKTQWIPSSPYHELWQQNLMLAQGRIVLLYYSPLPILFLLLVPWIGLRLVFWIVNANEVVQERKEI